MIRVGLIGAGHIGRERAAAIQYLSDLGKPVVLSAIYDLDFKQAEILASEYKSVAFDSVDSLLASKLDWVLVAIAHDSAVFIVEKALAVGCKVLMEKPMGRDLKEARALMVKGGEHLKVGFNYRFFAGVRRALQDVRAGSFGKIIGIDFVLGHGCQPGLEKTWKLNFNRSGGGCLIDPGVHLLDLCLLLAPEKLEVIGGKSWSGFWKTGIEEDVRVLLSLNDMTISLHISIVQWRSKFEMQIQGVDRYGVVTGRNRSYGSQTYRTGPRWGWQSLQNQLASETLVLETDGSDSFIEEMDALLFPRNGEASWPGPCSSQEAYRVMELLDLIRSKLQLPRYMAPP